MGASKIHEVAQPFGNCPIITQSCCRWWRWKRRNYPRYSGVTFYTVWSTQEALRTSSRAELKCWCISFVYRCREFLICIVRPYTDQYGPPFPCIHVYHGRRVEQAWKEFWSEVNKHNPDIGSWAFEVFLWAERKNRFRKLLIATSWSDNKLSGVERRSTFSWRSEESASTDWGERDADACYTIWTCVVKLKC